MSLIIATLILQHCLKQRDSPCNGVKVIQFFFPGAAFSERYLGLPAKEEHAYSVRLKSSELNYSKLNGCDKLKMIMIVDIHSDESILPPN